MGHLLLNQHRLRIQPRDRIGCSTLETLGGVNEMDAFRIGFWFLTGQEMNLLFDNLDACLKAEQTIRKEYARSYSQSTWTEETLAKRSDPSVVSRYGAKTLRQLAFRTIA